MTDRHDDRLDTRVTRRTVLKAGAAVSAGAVLGPGFAAAEQTAPPPAFVDGAWTLAVLPDTQIYSQQHPEHFVNQTQWIVDQAQALNIQHVLHLGDIVNRGNKQPKQWDNAQAALDRLHGKVPLGIIPGNHDYDDDRGMKRVTQLNRVVPKKTLAQGKTLVDLYEAGKIDNQALAFETNRQKWLMLGLEFGPRNEVLAWAQKMLDKYSDHQAIVFTHAYMFSDETRYDHKTKKQSWNPSGYKLEGSFNDAEMMWTKVLRDARACGWCSAGTSSTMGWAT